MGTGSRCQRGADGFRARVHSAGTSRPQEVYGPAVRALRVSDVLDLAAAQSADSEARLEKLFEWDFERTMTSIRLLFGAAGSIVVALLATLFREDSALKAWHIAVISGSAAVLALIGAVLLWRARTVHRQYLASLQLLNSAQELGPLLANYRARRL
jgi:hypothetical protein